MKQICVLVLGMHRSGTSALTGILSLLDIYLGTELLKPQDDNLKGFYENQKIVDINEKIFKNIDTYWHDIFYNQKKLNNLNKNLIKELKYILIEEFEYSKIFAIKDPRLAYLFPLYKQVLNELNIDIKILLPYRNPIEVAKSLNKRDNFSLEKGMLLWAYHFLLAEKFSRGYKRAFVGFDELIDNTDSVIENISKALDLKFITKYKKNKKQISEFLEPSLKHHNISIDNLSHKTPAIVRNVLALKERLNVDSLDEEFDALREELFSYQKLFYNREIVSSLAEGQRAKEQLTQKEQELKEKHDECLILNDELKDSKQQLTKTKEQLTQKEQELKEKHDECLMLNDELKDSKQQLTKTKEQLTQKEQELKQKNDKCLMLNDELKDSKQQLTKIKEQLMQKEQELKQKNDKCLMLNDELKDSKQQLTKTKEQLTQKESLIQKQQEEIESLKDELVLFYEDSQCMLSKAVQKIKGLVK